jgi:O-antigen/teichoic acid export membrane protein
MQEVTGLKNLAIMSQTRQLIKQPWQVYREFRSGERHELPQLWNSLALISGRVASSGLGFLTWIIVARIYPTQEVGIATGIVAAMMLCVQIALIGIGSALISKYPQYQNHYGQVINTALNIVAVSSLVGATLFLLLASNFFQELNVVAASLSYILLFLGITLFGAGNSLMDHVSIALRRNEQVLVRNVAFGIVTLISVWSIPLITGRWGSESIIAAWCLAGLFAYSLGFIQLRRSVVDYRYHPELDRQKGGQLIRTGYPNYLLTLAERAPNWILPILVIELLSPTQNAHWYTVWMIAWVVFIVPISIGQNLFATVSRKPEMIADAVRKSLRTSLIIGVLAAISVIVLAPLLLLLLGFDYRLAGTLPLRILVLAVFPVSFIQAYYAVCRGTGRLGEAIMTGVVSGVVGIGLAAVAGLQFGLPGMAVAWLVSQTTIGIWATIRLRILTKGLSTSITSVPRQK